MTRREDIETLAVHAGHTPEPPDNAVVAPLVLSSTFAQSEPGQPLRWEYARSGNPTRAALERAIAALEGARFGFAFSSGSAAALTLLSRLGSADRIVSGDDVYGGTFRLFDKVLSRHGVETVYVDMRDLDAVRGAIDAKTRLVWMETPTNPLLKVFDIHAVATIAGAHGLPLVVDNTFASPMLQQPLSLGASVVLHSTTKYINGHSDVVGGALCTNDEQWASAIAFDQNAIGAVPSPFDCYLTLRGLRTLPLRMRRHSETALELARRLEGHPAVQRVHYPGLPSHPDHDLCSRQMSRPGGMVAFELSEGGTDPARRFLKHLRLFTLAESLGAVESLAEHPALMTHASIPPDVRRARGISDGLVRLSVGLEHEEDLWADLEAALSVR
jgi:cystathionine gamma-synthase/cystathionine gamma-lyase